MNKLRQSLESMSMTESNEANRESIQKGIADYKKLEICDLPDLSDPDPDNIVLVELTTINETRPPIPKKGVTINWNSSIEWLRIYPELPWGKPILSGKLDGETNRHWIEVKKKLSDFAGKPDWDVDIDVIETLIKDVASENYTFSSFDKTSLRDYMEHYNKDDDQKTIEFYKLIRKIAHLATRADALFPEGIPVLRSCSESVVDDLRPPFTNGAQVLDVSVTLSQEQCASLLACAFFNLFGPLRGKFPKFAFKDLLETTYDDELQTLVRQKLRFVFAYFSSVTSHMPTGIVSFRRVSLGTFLDKDMWEKLTKDSKISECRLHVAIGQKIEDQTNHIQMDFANKMIGGGTLTKKGSAQEEIRFLTCPEMIVSCLLCEEMDVYEAIHIVGAQTYSNYSGYGICRIFDFPLEYFLRKKPK
ncbi:hypothetical protein WR25_09153 [Diploscapter pachys]|uniref:poly(ADP-ribose) glycohydrolase n=1 Tax=Diploscapter pachys TaxID=2018661 RepID=A0A2A2LID0_9BILA|nr:hypothetical protein WR25_09153 [Diploscapter pachys]